jgi:hypothetical protein
MKRLHQFFVLLILYSLVLGIRVYWLSQKDGMNVDESLTVAIACYNSYMYTRNYEFNKEYTGKEVKEISLCDNDSLKNVLGDIRRLWSNSRDSAATNLYYSFLRLSLAGLKTGDIKPIIFRGGILNLILFTISFVFFFLLMRLLFPDSKLLQFAATACAFLSTAAISNTLYLRLYPFQETMFIVFCYYFFKTFYLNKYIIHNDKLLYINVRMIFILSLVTAFTLLTGYYSIVFIGLFGLYVIFVNYKKQDYMEIKFYILTLFLSLLFAHTFYNRYFAGYISHRATQTASTLFSDFFVNLQSSMTVAVTLFHRHFFTWPVIIVCALCLVYLVFLILRKYKFIVQKPALYILMVSMIYSLIILYIAPYKVLRYVMAVFPFLVILPVMLLNSIGKKKITIAIVLLLCAVFLKNALNQNNIENIDHNKPDKYYFSQNVDVPVFVFNKSPWKYADLVPYFNDEQVYYFIDKYEDILLTQHRDFYLIIEQTLEMPDTDLAQFEIESEFSISYFICKRYNKK